GAGSYSNQWCGATASIDATTDIPYFKGSTLGPLNTIELEEGYYSFRIVDEFNQQHGGMRIAVLKTSAPPVSLRRQGQEPTEPTADDPIVVTITLDKPKSPEERIYVRWSNDLFITSNLVEAEGSKTSYTATIPPQPTDVPIQYTIISSSA